MSLPPQPALSMKPPMTSRSALPGCCPDYVHERLLIASLRKHPEILDWLHRQHGEASTRISLALQDWLQLASDR